MKHFLICVIVLALILYFYKDLEKIAVNAGNIANAVVSTVKEKM